MVPCIRVTARGYSADAIRSRRITRDVPMSTANLNDGLVALKDGKMILLRVPYPLDFYAKGFDGRIDDPNAGWKGRGLWTTSGDRTPRLMEGGKGRSPSPYTSSCAPIRSRTDRSNES